MKFIFNILLLHLSSICLTMAVSPQAIESSRVPQAPLASPATAKKTPSPTVITSDKLEMINNPLHNQNEFHFDGNVKIVGDDLNATADQLIVFADKTADKNASQVGTMKEMIATGHVHIVQPERRATAGKAVIYPQIGKMILLENPVVFSKDNKGGENKVTGDRMELYRDDNRAVVSGQKERPKITLMGLAGMDLNQKNPETKPKQEAKTDESVKKATDETTHAKANVAGLQGVQAVKAHEQALPLLSPQLPTLATKDVKNDTKSEQLASEAVKSPPSQEKQQQQTFPQQQISHHDAK